MSSVAGFGDSRDCSVEALLAGQRRVLEMIANDAPLEDTLTSLAQLIESQFDGMLCSVVLLDEDGQHMRHGAAPSLPDSYCTAINGIAIGPNVGSCGTAMFRREPVIVTDILRDPLWEDYRALASLHGLRACWSTPIAGHQGKILGSFAAYYREVKGPDAAESEGISAGTLIASIAIDRQRMLAGQHVVHTAGILQNISKLERAEEAERLLASIVQSATDAIISKTLRGIITSWNPGAEALYGYSAEEAIGRSISILTPPDRASEARIIVERAMTGQKTFHHDTVRVRKDGSKIDVSLTVSPIRDKAGAIRQICVIAHDITDRKQAEEALRKSEACERAKSKELETVLDTVPASVFIAHDLECRYMTTNRTGYEELRLAIGTNVSRSALPLKLPGVRFLQDGIEVSAKDLPMQRAAASGHPVYGVPLSLVFEDGTERHTLFNAVPLRGEDGRPFGVVGASIDVTERKRAEDALQEREKTQRLILDHLSVGVILSSVGEEVALYENPRFRELFGHSIKSVEDWWPLAYPDPAYREWVSQEWHRRLTEASRVQGEIRPMDVTVTCHDGSKKHVRVLAKVIGDLNFVTFIDLSERRQAEDALKKSEEKFSKAFRQSPMVLTLTRIKDNHFVEVNETFERITGWRRDEVLGRTPFDIELWVDPAERVELTKTLISEGHLRGAEVRYRMRDGSIRIGLATAEVIELNGEPCMLAVVADITERKQAEDALQHSEQNYRMFITQSSEGIFREDFDAPIPIDLREEELSHRILHDSYIAECNDALARLYGFSSGKDLTGRRLTDILVASDPRNLQFIQDFIRSGFQIRDRESHEVDSQGNPKVFLTSMTGIVENGKLARTWGIQRDITEWVKLDEARRKTEEALRNAELKYRTIFEEAVIGIFQSTPEGECLSANPILARMFGYDSPEEFITCVNGRCMQFEVYPGYRQEFVRIMQESGRVRNFEVQVYRKNGTVMWLSINARAVREGEVVVRYEGMSEDITDRKLLEGQLLQAQKLEALGSLAGGIAHDFNNVLGVILGQGELLLQKLEPSDASRQRIEQIRQAGKRGAALTEQLLAFSRRQILRPSTLDLNEIVENFSSMIANLIGEDVLLVRVLEPGLGLVSADAGQIEQVLMNLAVNARDAMPRGGTIRIRTSNTEMDEEYVRQHSGVKPGLYVALTVSDTGHGMDEVTMTRIFEPFYTTKEVGKGTGLGLSTVYGIVQQSGGHISVASALGEGTTFSIYLPRVVAGTIAENMVKKPVRTARGSETILLVEDAAPLREVTREFLRGTGYTVLEAGDASEALETAERYSAKISLLITDVVLPGINGRALAEQLVSRRPGTKVLYISGYTDDAVVRNGVLQSDIAFLKKPFSRHDLVLKVREILDAVA